MVHSPVLVVLAAGRGSRFARAPEDGEARGQARGATTHKLAHAFGDSTVLGCTLANAVRSQLPLVVVTTAALLGQVTTVVASRDVIVLPEVDGAVAGAVDQGVAGAIYNDAGSQAGGLSLGMGYSIAAGVSARAQAGGWLVLPGDMPLVQAATLREVATALAHHAVVYAQHQGQRGHPVGFAAELYSELAQLKGDEGARRLVARYPAFGVEVADGGVLADVDTPQDLYRLRAMQAAGAEVENR